MLFDVDLNGQSGSHVSGDGRGGDVVNDVRRQVSVGGLTCGGVEKVEQAPGPLW
jgi:hypothetical protein